MKIKLKSNGQIINPPLRVAERYIRLGKAIAYVEPAVVEPKSKKKSKAKKEEVFESQVTQEEAAPEEVQEL
jgi:hypothetical protein